MLNTGRMLINLKDKRSSNQEEIMTRLRNRVAQIAGVTLYLQPTQDLTIDAETGPTQYRVSIEGADNATVTEWAGKLVARLQDDKKVRNVVTDAGATGVAAFVSIDRDSASRLSITAATIDDALYSAFGQRIVSTIFTETNQYRVILEAQRDAGMSIEALKRLPLQAPAPASRPRSRRSPPSPSSRRRCRSPTWRSTRPPPSASTPRPASRSAPRSTRSAPPPPTSSCRRR